MADLNALTYCRLVGLYSSVVADSVGPYGDNDTRPDQFRPYMDATITVFVAGSEGHTPELRLENATPPRTVLLTPIDCVVEAGVFRLKSQTEGVAGVDIIAKSSVMGLGEKLLLCRVDFGPTHIASRTFQYEPVTFKLPTVEREDYTAGVHQRVRIVGSPTSGTWRLLYEGAPTATQSHNATEVQLQASLRALPTIGNDVTVTGPVIEADGDRVYDVVFTGALAADIPSPLTASHSFPDGARVEVEDLYQPVVLDLSTVDRVDLPPSTPSTIVVRMIPDDVRPVPSRPGAFQFFSDGDALGQVIEVPIGDSIATEVAAIVPEQVDAAVTALDVPGQVSSAVVAQNIPGKVDAAVTAANLPGQVTAAVTAANLPGQVTAAVAAENIPGKVSAEVDAQNIPGQVNAAVAAAPTVTNAAAAAVNNQLATSDVIKGGDPRAMVKTARDDVLFYIGNDLDQATLTIDDKGAVSVPGLSIDGTFSEQSIPAGKVYGLAALSDSSGYAWAITNSQDQAVGAVTVDGRWVDFSAAAKEVPLLEVSGVSPNRALWSLSPSTGARTLITDTGDPSNPTVDAAGTVLWDSTSGKRALVGGVVVPAFPDRSTIACWGDSLTEGSSKPWWPEMLDGLVSATVVNCGKSGNTIDEIAVRQGGRVLQLSVTGGAIPASGPVNVTSTQALYFRTDTVGLPQLWTQTGTIAGVAGTLTSTGTLGTWTFTRAQSGGAVPVSGVVPFVSDAAVANAGNVAIIMAGRNDVNSGPGSTSSALAIPNPIDRVIAGIEAIVGGVKAYHKEYVVLGVTTGTADTYGNVNANNVMVVNDKLSKIYGNRFFGLQNYLRTQCLADAGITPTAQDNIDIANGIIPSSLMYDSGHFNSVAATQVAKVLQGKLSTLGWV